MTLRIEFLVCGNVYYCCIPCRGDCECSGMPECRSRQTLGRRHARALLPPYFHRQLCLRLSGVPAAFNATAVCITCFLWICRRRRIKEPKYTLAVKRDKTIPFQTGCKQINNRQISTRDNTLIEWRCKIKDAEVFRIIDC